MSILPQPPVFLPFPAINVNGVSIGDATDAARACRQRIDVLDVSQGHKDGLHGIVDAFTTTVDRLAARSGWAPDDVKVNGFVNGHTDGLGTITLSEFRVTVLPAKSAFVDDSTINNDPPVDDEPDVVEESAPVARKKR